MTLSKDTDRSVLWLLKAEASNSHERSISLTLISQRGSEPHHHPLPSHLGPGTILLLIRSHTRGASTGGEGDKTGMGVFHYPVALWQIIYYGRK